LFCLLQSATNVDDALPTAARFPFSLPRRPPDAARSGVFRWLQRSNQHVNRLQRNKQPIHDSPRRRTVAYSALLLSLFRDDHPTLPARVFLVGRNASTNRSSTRCGPQRVFLLSTHCRSRAFFPFTSINCNASNQYTQPSTHCGPQRFSHNPRCVAIKQARAPGILAMFREFPLVYTGLDPPASTPG